MSNIILIGDSLFANWTKGTIDALQERIPGSLVINCATGGHNSRDVLPRAQVLSEIKDATFLLSVGMNDLASWKRIPVEEYREYVRKIVTEIGANRLWIMELEVLVEHLQPGPDIRTNAERDLYNEALLDVAKDTDCNVIYSSDAFKELVSREVVFYKEDGVHYNDIGTTLLLDKIAEALG